MCFRYLLLICLLAPLVVNGQQLLQAPYSSVQASNGDTLYQQNCATCHLPDLQGSLEAPALNDTNFRSNWTNHGVNELLDLLRRTMPPQAPGSLDEAGYLQIVAFLLRANNIRESSIELTASDNSVVFLENTGNVEAQQNQRSPVPGIAGTITTPGTRNSVPEIATIYRSGRAITRSFRVVPHSEN